MEDTTIAPSAPAAAPETSPVPVSAPETTSTPSAPESTPTPSSQPSAPANSGDSFTTFDPSQLTDPNLQAAYKQMQGDYTRKMQAISQAETRYNQYAQYAPIIDEMLSRGRGNQTPAQQSPELVGLEKQLREAGYDDDSVKAMKIGAEFVLNRFNQTMEQNAYVGQVLSGIEKAASLDPRLNDTSLVYDIGDGSKASYGEIVEELVSADTKWQQDPVAATQRAIKKVDAMINASKTAGKQELSQAATEKGTKFPPVNSSPQSSAPAGQVKTVGDAAQLAMKQLGISA